MIVSRSPLRLGLLGGGSDVPSYFENCATGGSVLGLTINLYVYVNILPLSPIAGEQLRITYRKTESVSNLDELEHPVVRAVLQARKIEDRLNIGTMSDVPGGTGLGSSSSFTVGLIKALDKFVDARREPLELAKEAIFIERTLLQEAGGWQDQFHASVGGFRKYDFFSNGVEVAPKLRDSTSEGLEGWLLLVWTGIVRHSHEEHQRMSINEGPQDGRSQRHQEQVLSEMVGLTRETYKALAAGPSPTRVPYLLADSINDGWKLKKGLGVGLAGADDIIGIAVDNGALAGKLCGAGGGGFVMLLVPPNKRTKVTDALSPRKVIEVSPVATGVKVSKF